MKRFPRASSITVLVAHALAAIGWLFLMPGGFAVMHPRFWVNRVVPIFVVLLEIGGLVARVRKQTTIVDRLGLIFPCAWAGAAIAGVITFPISGWIPAAFAAFGTSVMFVGLRPLPRFSWKILFVALLSALIGAALPLTQRGRAPRTISLADEIEPAPAEDTRELNNLPGQKIGEDVRVQPANGLTTMQFGKVELSVQPMLSFISRSPDRCWTLLAPRGSSRTGPRELVALQRDERLIRTWYRDDDVSTLAVNAVSPDRIELIARSRIPAPVYSHLNSYCEMTVYGHHRLSVAFSPCPQTRVELKHAGYPFGAPARFAYFDGHDRLRVVEATNAEKGPFHELASGIIHRGESLSLTLFDDNRAICKITLHDFTAQASDEISPTAGWGVPANSIQLDLYQDSPTSPAGIWFSLADTGIGRGWDSVGHSAGVYRNRMTIERIADKSHE